MSFDTLPDNARLWLLALETAPAPELQLQLQQGVTDIIGQWRHKGQAYQGGCTLLQGQIIAVAEPTLAANPSGCAIDGMLRKLNRLTESLALTVVNPANAVLVRLQGELKAVPKASLAQLLEQGTLTATTPVLDLALYTLGDLRAGRLEAPLGTTWIARSHAVA